MAKIQEKKKFYVVEVPLLNKEIELYGRDGEFSGKHIKLDLTNNLKGKGLEINFLIEEKDGKITTIPKQLYLHGFYIRRMLRKGTDYVEDSFLTQCKDNRLRIKPFLITRKRVSNQVLRGLREKAKEEINKYIQDKSFEIIVKDVLNGKLQKEILPALKKIYPLGLCEIRFVGIENLKEHEKYEQERKDKLEYDDIEQEKIILKKKESKEKSEKNLNEVSDESFKKKEVSSKKP